MEGMLRFIQTSNNIIPEFIPSLTSFKRVRLIDHEIGVVMKVSVTQGKGFTVIFEFGI